jgi:integrase
MTTTKSKETSKRRSPGGIGITKRGDKYEATYNIPKSQLPSGSPRKRITVQGETEAAATAALLEKLQAPALLSKKQEEEMRKRLGSDGILREGEYQKSDQSHKGPTLAQWVEEWTTDYIHEDLQESTKKIYFGHINTYILPYVGKRYINDLTTKVLKREWWNPITQLKKIDKDGELTDEPLLGPSVRANIYKTMRMLLITAYHKHGTNVSLSTLLMPIPRTSRPESDQEVKVAAEKLRKLFIDEPNKEDPRWSLFALSLLGLRQGERLAIRVSDIDLSDEDDPVIYIHQQLDFLKERGGWYLKDVTKNGEPRAIPLWGIFLEAVEKQLELRKEWAKSKEWKPEPLFADLLFLQPGGKLWTRRQDTPAWHEYVGPGIRGHLARHITGHILAEEGIGLESAKLLLGHKSDVYAYYYRIASTREAGRELRAIQPRAPKPVKKKTGRLYMIK